MNTPSISPQTRRASVLVVDDSADNLLLMSELLGDLYAVKVAKSGARALKIALSDNPPDLILLDIMMPEMDGYEVCRQLQADARTRAIPIIFLTALTDSSDEQKGLEMGAVDFITKPISASIVLARVKTNLSLKASADMLKNQNVYLEQEIHRMSKSIKNLGSPRFACKQNHHRREYCSEPKSYYAMPTSVRGTISSPGVNLILRIRRRNTRTDNLKA